MQMKHIAMATLLALSLAACGGSDSPTTKATEKPQLTAEQIAAAEKAAAEKKAAEEAEAAKNELDPTTNNISAGVDPSTAPTVGKQQYLRDGATSTFDRNFNRDRLTSGTAVQSVSLDDQNPNLTNIVLARVQDQKTPGQPFTYYVNTRSTDMADATSLQTENAKNVAAVVAGDPAAVTTQTGLVTVVQDAAGNPPVVNFIERSVNYQNHAETLTGPGAIVGAEAAQLGDDTTRIFGHFYLAPAGTPEAANTFVKDPIQRREAQANDLAYGVATLNRVQYGRVSNNANVDVNPVTNGFVITPFVAANDTNAVNTYFARGVDATTVEEMGNLGDGKGISIDYHGHALMYGIDNSYHGNSRALPGAPGSIAGQGVGNFVYATLDTGKATVEGSVYNVWTRGNFTQTDPLVSFGGKVAGNTVVGTADRTYVAGQDDASFRASFHGANAEEMAGSFNSTTEQYGTEGAVWGGVFGAVQVQAAQGGNGNAWLTEDPDRAY